jgi:hypothetical protein
MKSRNVGVIVTGEIKEEEVINMEEGHGEGKGIGECGTSGSKRRARGFIRCLRV